MGYFETIIFSLRAAKQLLLLLLSAENQRIVPFPSPGKNVMFGKVELALKISREA